MSTGAIPSEPTVSQRAPNHWEAVTAAALAVFMATIDTTIVAVALPTIGQELDAGPQATQWVVLAYTSPMVALTLPAGRWADAIGTRPAFVLALAGFGVVSLLAALSPTLGWLLAARAVQGVFGALLSALVLAVVTAAVPESRRGRALGLVGTIGPLGSVAGPGLGGLLVSVAGWPTIFLINVPVSAVAVWLSWRAVPGGGRLRLPRPARAAEAAAVGVACVAASWRWRARRCCCRRTRAGARTTSDGGSRLSAWA